MPLIPATAAAATAYLHGAGAPLPAAPEAGTALHALNHANDLARRLGTPVLGGNRARLRGPQGGFEAACTAIDSARDHINVELRIVQAQGAGGLLADKLIARCRAGVRVNVLHDSLGSLAAAAAQVQRLRDAGVRLCGYRPVSRWHVWRSSALPLRAHRKLLVVDGRIGLVGADFSAEFDNKDGTTDNAAPDLHVQLEGPAVRHMQQLFIAQWLRHSGSALQQARYFPPLAPVGAHRVGVAACESGRCPNPQHGALLGAIAAARSQVLLRTAYRSPPGRLLRALLAAAERGVRVELMLPAAGDGWLPLPADWLNHAHHHAQLLQAGVLIHHCPGGLLQARSCAIDGVWASVGSANSDEPGLVDNAEANLVVVDAGFAQQLEQAFRTAALQARPAQPAVRLQPAPWQRGLQTLARRFAFRL